MSLIRPFRNADLPELLSVWMGHWTAAGRTPKVSVGILDRAITSRLFFRPEDLLVAVAAGRVVGWCHCLPASSDDENVEASIPMICFSGEAGVAACDDLLAEAEAQLIRDGARSVVVGVVRDQSDGYTGLSPIGHGIGVPICDARTASLLSRHGYHVARSVNRMTVVTSTYRPPVTREFMQFRRLTRAEREPILPRELQTGIAMSHFDIERFHLVDHRTGAELAVLDAWISDPEAMVMNGSEAILSFDLVGSETTALMDPPRLSDECQFLVTLVIQSLSHRHIFSLETSVDSSATALVTQLTSLNFANTEQGRQWQKQLSEADS